MSRRAGIVSGVPVQGIEGHVQVPGGRRDPHREQDDGEEGDDEDPSKHGCLLLLDWLLPTPVDYTRLTSPDLPPEI